MKENKSKTIFFLVLVEGCVKFLKKQATDLGLPLAIYSKFPTKPIAVITWVGQEPASPSILLNSHMDVVPVFEVSPPNSIFFFDNFYRRRKTGHIRPSARTWMRRATFTHVDLRTWNALAFSILKQSEGSSWKALRSVELYISLLFQVRCDTRILLIRYPD